MQENSYNQVRTYFKELVEKSTFLNDFVGFSQREWATRTASLKSLSTPYLALFRYELGLDGPRNNTIAVRRVGFAIMYNNIKADDLEGQYNAIHNAEMKAIKVLSRINFDNNFKEHFLYNSFIKESVEINTVELSGNEFGVEVFFNFRNKQLIQVSPGDWLDIEQVC